MTSCLIEHVNLIVHKQLVKMQTEKKVIICFILKTLAISSKYSGQHCKRFLQRQKRKININFFTFSEILNSILSSWSRQSRDLPGDGWKLVIRKNNARSGPPPQKKKVLCLYLNFEAGLFLLMSLRNFCNSLLWSRTFLEKSSLTKMLEPRSCNHF